MSAPSTDPLLEGYLSSPEVDSRGELLRLLSEQAQPIVERILTSRQCADADLREEVLLRLIERLQGLRQRPDKPAIADFRGYVAVATFHALAEHRRKMSRERQRVASDAEGDRLVRMPDPRSNTAADFERRSWLRSLWNEIRQLPPRQCAALILNLRDDRGRGAAVLLPLTGTASMRQIAEALAIPAKRLAEIWNHLPLDDAAIAGLLGTTRQQVVNLRKAARERLARRMKRTY